MVDYTFMVTMIRGSLQKWSRVYFYLIIIDRIDIREVRVKKKINELEIKLRKNVELNEESKAKPDIVDVIRRRKGKPDKRISRKLNLQ